jgi:hypothetical protein
MSVEGDGASVGRGWTQEKVVAREGGDGGEEDNVVDKVVVVKVENVVEALVPANEVDEVLEELAELEQEPVKEKSPTGLEQA